MSATREAWEQVDKAEKEFSAWLIAADADWGEEMAEAASHMTGGLAGMIAVLEKHLGPEFWKRMQHRTVYSTSRDGAGEP